jgi:orotate phosphoribosyltransferase
MKVRSAGKMVKIEAHPLKTLHGCGGFYTCPKDDDGKRRGPLVGYAGEYEATDGTKKQWVGDIYANFAKAEEYPFVLYHFAEEILPVLSPYLNLIDVFCGAPLGGYDFAKMLGLVHDRRAIKAEKKVIALATENSREKSILIFGRHEVRSGDDVAIVEDVCNNFSTTDKLISLIEKSGGRVAAIVCLLNRSTTVDSVYSPAGGSSDVIPVISLVRLPTDEYKQDDPAVKEDIGKGNIAWKPKDEWGRLMAAME